MRDVPVRARTAADAQRWAEWLVTNGITTYATASAYRARWEHAVARFPEHRVATLSQRDLAARFCARSGPNPPRD